MEKFLLHTAIDMIVAAGYSATVDYGDGPGARWKTKEDLVRETYQGDEDVLMIYKEGQADELGWLKFVYGNDGWDALSDYSISLEAEFGKPLGTAAEKLDSGEFVIVLTGAV